MEALQEANRHHQDPLHDRPLRGENYSEEYKQAIILLVNTHHSSRLECSSFAAFYVTVNFKGFLLCSQFRFV